MKELLKEFWEGIVQGFWEGVADALAVFGIAFPIMGLIFSTSIAMVILSNFMFAKGLFLNTTYSAIAWLQFIGMETVAILFWIVMFKMGGYVFNRAVNYFKKVRNG